jgi:micrococcal nuclease
MKCRDSKTGHAFRIARLRVELLPKRQPAGGVTPSPSTPPPSGGSGCNPNYAGACIPNVPYDLDCGDIAARGFRVVGTDVYNFDGEGDGIACES